MTQLKTTPMTEISVMSKAEKAELLLVLSCGCWNSHNRLGLEKQSSKFYFLLQDQYEIINNGMWYVSFVMFWLYMKYVCIQYLQKWNNTIHVLQLIVCFFFFLTSLCVSTHRSIPFFLLVTKYSTIQLDQNLFNHFPKERHLYCFQFFYNPKKYLLYVLTLPLALFLIFSPFITIL